MATSLRSQNEQTTIGCDTCENTAKHLCKTCHDRLCDKCKIIHSKSKGTFDHEVTILTFEALTSTMECPSHHVCKWHSKRADIGCQKCEVPVCKICIIGEHNGHYMIDIFELFQLKKKKLEEKLTKVRSELYKFESRLEEVRRSQKNVLENRDAVKTNIIRHVEGVIATLNKSKDQLLHDADEKAKVSLQILDGRETILQSLIKNMQGYISNIEGENLQEQIAFIFYTMSAVDVSLPEVFPTIPNPGLLKYSEDGLPDNYCQELLGHVTRSEENINLRTNEGMEVIKNINLANAAIVSLSFCSTSETFWVFTNAADEFLKCDEKGKLENKISVNILLTPNKPICVVDNDAFVIYRNDRNTISMLQGTQQKLFIDFTTMWVTCLCSTSSGDVLAGLMHSTTCYYSIVRFNLNGECKQCISHLKKKMTFEPFPFGNVIRAYIAENLNGDICLSFDSSNSQSVILFHRNGDHKITYKGVGSSISKPFLPRGICTNIIGHILIADENNCGIHILNKEGDFVTLFTIPGEPYTVPITLCVDNKDNLCVGCGDGKMRILKYLD